MAVIGEIKSLRPPSWRRAARRLLAAAIPAAVLAACATAPVRDSSEAGGGSIPHGPAGQDSPAVPPSARSPLGPGDELEARATLTLMSDRRLYEPIAVEAIRRDYPALAPQLALSLGRIGDRRGRLVLQGLLGSDRREVRRGAAFALGWLGDAGAAPSLLRAVADPDRETGRLAVEALARLEIPLVEVVEAAEGLDAVEHWARLLPELFRFKPEEVVALAGAALESAGSPEMDSTPWAVYALGRTGVGADPPDPSVAGLLRGALSHPDAWTRGWAARGLGTAGEGGDLDAIGALLKGEEAGPIVQALRAGTSLVAAGKAAAPAAWRPRILELLDDLRPGVRLSTIEHAGRWLLDAELGDALAKLASRDSEALPRERELALLSLSAGNDPRAEALVTAAAQARGDSNATLRAAAATAAGILGARRILARLEEDPSPAVRMAVLWARFELAGEPGDGAIAIAESRAITANEARRALLDPHAAVRATALEWLAENPEAPYEEITLAIGGAEARRMVDLRIDGVAALLARAEAEPLERGAIVAVLERLAEDRDFLVRREAGGALEALDRPRPPVGPVDTGRSLTDYRDLAWRAAGEDGSGRHRIDMRTNRGSVRLELDCDQAPMTCVSFLQLVSQKFYDGLPFHRVVPDFVIQGGDPEGSGWGGPGYSLRNEPNLLRYERGVLGMARSGLDTAGSQFFITLSRQPHLNGAYTAFGRVVGGDAVLDSIVQGDFIETMVEVPMTTDEAAGS